MLTLQRMLWLLCLAALMTGGCGTAEQEYVDVPVQEVTPTQQARDWLEGVANSGQLDSGAVIIKDYIEAMRADGATNVDELLKDADELIAMQNPGQIRAKAKEMLGKLPQ